jgi:prolyl oligopeptidase
VPAPSASPAPISPIASVANEQPTRPSWASEYPATRTSDVTDTLFGVAVKDPYRWLEDGKSPEVRSWMESEDALTRKKLDALPERAALVSRLREVLYTESRGVPIKRGGRLFFTARTATQEKAVLYVRGADGKDRVLLDPNSWPTKDNPSLHGWHPSPDGTKLAYSLALHSADAATIHVVDVATAQEATRDAISEDSTGATWAADSKGFYYSFTPMDVPAAVRPGAEEIRFHRLGEDPAKDTRVRDKIGDPSLWLDFDASRDGHWLTVSVWSGHVSKAVYFRDLRARGPAATTWATLCNGDHARVTAYAYKDRFYLVTTDGAPNSRVMVADPAHPAYEQWKEIVPERKDARLEDLSIVGGKLVLKYVKDATSRLEVHGLAGDLVREIPLPELGTASLPPFAPDDDEASFLFSSFTRPPEIERVSIKTGASKVWYRESSIVDLSRFQTKQVFYSSKDGTRVPMFIVHAKDLKRDGTAPTILNAYGGFDITYGSEFRPILLPWLERGGVYAWANLRGGGEYGEKWHEAGMLHNKQNVFDDFFAAAEYLLKEGYTTPERLVARGGSNGGLLMGAAFTQRPELFRVVLCGAPLLDMIRFPLVGNGGEWTTEYGNPTKEDDFRALLAYSPLHHVQSGVRYPSLLLMSPANDDRVDPMHARKFVAEVQSASTGGPALLRIERDSGHMGADSQKSEAGYYGDAYAFALAEIGAVGGSMNAK